MELDAITEKIIGCAYDVSNTLGSGFVEKVVPYDAWKRFRPHVPLGDVKISFILLIGGYRVFMCTFIFGSYYA
ncbi:MAG: GxxExxY protein [Anaerolineales bacterium]